MNEAHDPRFSVFVAELFTAIEQRRNLNAGMATWRDLLEVLEQARERGFGPAD